MVGSGWGGGGSIPSVWTECGFSSWWWYLCKVVLILGVKMMRVFILGNERVPGGRLAELLLLKRKNASLPRLLEQRDSPRCDGFLNICTCTANKGGDRGGGALVSKWDGHLLKRYLHPVRQGAIKANIRQPFSVSIQFRRRQTNIIAPLRRENSVPVISVSFLIHGHTTQHHSATWNYFNMV